MITLLNITGEESDLRQDKYGHGTMVAGVIAENGPENIQIINFKVRSNSQCENN